MELNLLSIIFLILGLFVGAIIVIVTYMIRKKNLAIKAADMISEAVRKAEEAKNNSLAEIKAESLRVKEETDKEVKERKQELKELEDRLDKRETSLDKRYSGIFSFSEISLFVNPCLTFNSTISPYCS